MAASPLIAFYDYDGTRPPDDIAHLWYAVSLYPDHIDLSKWDNDNGHARTVFASVPVSDLATVFHKIRLTRGEGASRSLRVYLDDSLVVSIAGEPVDRELNAYGFGLGLADGIGTSEFDYVKCWESSDEPVPARNRTWGRIKALYGKPRG